MNAQAPTGRGNAARSANTMNQNMTYIIGPESVLAVFCAATFWFCSRHNSGTGRDVELMEKLVMLLPFVVVPVVFATIFVPGAKSWWWLGRAIVLTFAVLMICGGRLISGFGMGAKGQDAAFILIIAFGIVGVALATSISGAMILAEHRPGFADWFRARKIMGSILTLLMTLPIGVVLGVTVCLGIGVLGGLYSAFKR